MEFHHALKMDLSGDPETRHKQLVGINDGNYPNHPVFLQVAEHLWSKAGHGAPTATDATDAVGKSDGKILSKKKNWYTTLWNFMKTPGCYLKYCGKGITQHIYLPRLGYGMAWAIEPAGTRTTTKKGPRTPRSIRGG